MPAHNTPSFILLHDLTGATHNGKPYSIGWTVFVKVGLAPKRQGDFTAVILKNHFTGEEVAAPIRNIGAYPKIVMIEEEYSFFQRHETYDTEPQRLVEDGFVALKVEGVPDAKIPAHLVSPATCHTHQIGYAVV